jgi:uncharacterized membrane protein
MKKVRLLFITRGAIIAALYVALTFVSNALGLASGVIQLRLSEALAVLPFFTPAAIPGLFVGCALSNLLTGCAPWDVLFGSIATLLGAVGAYLLRGNKWLVPVPTIVSNTLIIPFILSYVYGAEGTIPFFMLTVGLGELISCGVFGMLLLTVLKRYQRFLF